MDHEYGDVGGAGDDGRVVFLGGERRCGGVGGGGGDGEEGEAESGGSVGGEGGEADGVDVEVGGGEEVGVCGEVSEW